MQIVLVDDRRQMGSYVASQAAGILRTCLSQKDSVNLVVATGSSQFEVLSQLVVQPDIDWSRVNGFHLDEYLGLERNHPASFCGYLQQRFVRNVPIGSFFFLDGAISPEILRQNANEKLLNRQIDLMLCGIGENGHLAFNDPPADFLSDSPYLVVQLDEACRRQQVGEGWFEGIESVPKQAISMSIRQIMKADAILCSVPDSRKAEAVKNAVEGPVTPLVPASILQQHPNVCLILDVASSSHLSEETLSKCQRLPIE